jgi:hypothetical protein
MADEALSQNNSLQLIERGLLNALRERHAEWQRATDDTRDIARHTFLNALYAFQAFVVDGELPGNVECATTERVSPKSGCCDAETKLPIGGFPVCRECEKPGNTECSLFKARAKEPSDSARLTIRKLDGRSRRKRSLRKAKEIERLLLEEVNRARNAHDATQKAFSEILYEPSSSLLNPVWASKLLADGRTTLHTMLVWVKVLRESGDFIHRGVIPDRFKD